MDFEPSDEQRAQSLTEQFGYYDHRLDLSSYKYPTIDLLENCGTDHIVRAEELDAAKHTIIDTLAYGHINITQIRATIGPRLTLYEITPAAGMRVAAIKNMEADIALRLARHGVRVTGPIPGKGTMAIEVPHQTPSLVSLRSLIATEAFQNSVMDLPITMGKTMTNEVFIADLAKLPHLLIAGATGQGKSVCLNTLLVSLLYKKHPAELKMVLIDINRLELGLFETIERHYLAKLPAEAKAVITDATKAIATLNALCIELDQRYGLFQDAQVRNIKEYNQKLTTRKISDPQKHRYLPFIVLVIDEFAELLTPGKEVELVISRLAQLGRAAGIHLIISTQRPSVKVITGTIKANFTARLAFRVSSNSDSRTILDNNGAELLHGQGDMLLSTGTELIHLQGAYVSTAEVKAICDFIGSQRGYPTALLLPEYISEAERLNNLTFDPDEIDPFFEDSARLIVLHQQGSISLIQRKLKLGYNRAGRIISQLEAAGIIGPFEGSKAREVLIPDEYALEEFLRNLSTGPAPLVAASVDPVIIPTAPLKSALEIQAVISAEPVLERKSFWNRLFN